MYSLEQSFIWGYKSEGVPNNKFLTKHNVKKKFQSSTFMTAEFNLS